MYKNNLKADEILKGELYASILFAVGKSIKDNTSIFKLARQKNNDILCKWVYSPWIPF